jgi:hypothetical protein
MRCVGYETVMTNERRGRQFTRRKVFATTPDGGELEYLNPLDFCSQKDVERHKLAAINRLETAGIPARRMLAEHPGGSALRDYVLNCRDHEADSVVGLAARICEVCIRLDELSKRGARASMLIGEAYRLGRLVTLANVYEHQTAVSRKAATAVRDQETRDKVRQAWQADIDAGKPKRGRIKRVALSLNKPESTVRSALEEPKRIRD